MVTMVFIVIRPGTLWEEKGFIFLAESLITTHKFNNHSSISLFLAAWLCKLTRHQCTCSHFITIAYNLIPRVLSPDEVVFLTLYVCPHSWLGFCFWKPRRVFRPPTSDFRLPTSDFRLPTSDFQLPTSDFRKIQKLFFFSFRWVNYAPEGSG